MTKICVVGMGRSGEAAVRLAIRLGHSVRLLEQREDATMQRKTANWVALGAEVFLGAHQTSMLQDVSEIVVSPGVSARSEIFAWAQSRGIPITGEMEWSAQRFSGKLIAVTGTNGKTTTTALIAHLLNENGVSAAACGNIGVPLSQVLLSEPAPQIAVAEISSFQWETARTLRPFLSVFLNFTPDHLDRHADMQVYLRAKLKMYQHQGAGDWALFHSDLRERLEPLMVSGGIAWATFGLDSRVSEIAPESPENEQIVWKGKGPLCRTSDVPLLGDHNTLNACAAAAAASLCGLTAPAISKAMQSFRAVEHRLQLVAQRDGVRFINDSKATNVDSLAVALRAFPEKVVLIAGGRDKHQDFSSLAPLIAEKTRAAILIGEGAPKMAQQWRGKTEILHAPSMQEAVQVAWNKAKPRGVVLLSPACASFDMFTDYEQRGREFVRCVNQIGGAYA